MLGSGYAIGVREVNGKMVQGASVYIDSHYIGETGSDGWLFTDNQISVGYHEIRALQEIAEPKLESEDPIGDILKFTHTASVKDLLILY
jgi:hypothetical protein